MTSNTDENQYFLDNPSFLYPSILPDLDDAFRLLEQRPHSHDPSFTKLAKFIAELFLFKFSPLISNMSSLRNSAGSKGQQGDAAPFDDRATKRVDNSRTPPRLSALSTAPVTPTSPPKVRSVIDKAGINGPKEDTADEKRAARLKMMEKANADLQASLAYRFYPTGLFKSTVVASFLKTKHGNVWNGAIVPKHYISQKDGNDKKSIHDMCVKAVPKPFTYVYPNRTWRKGTQDDFVTLAKVCLRQEDKWTSEETGQQLRNVLISFAKTSPEKFDDLYGTAGTLLPSPETFLWVAANTLLGSFWRFGTVPPKPALKAKKLAFAEGTTGAVSATTKT